MRLDRVDRASDDHGMIVQAQVGTSHEINDLRSTIKRTGAQNKRASGRGTSLDRHETSGVSCIEIRAALIDHVGGVPKMSRPTTIFLHLILRSIGPKTHNRRLDDIGSWCSICANLAASSIGYPWFKPINHLLPRLGSYQIG